MILASSPRRASEEPHSSTVLNRLVEALFLPCCVLIFCDAPYWRPPMPRTVWSFRWTLMVSKPVSGYPSSRHPLRTAILKRSVLEDHHVYESGLIVGIHPHQGYVEPSWECYSKEK